MSESIGREILDKDMSASDKKIKGTLMALEENAKVADIHRKQYEGKFVAVHKGKVIGNDTDLDSLRQKIGSKASDLETFIGYITEEEESGHAG